MCRDGLQVVLTKSRQQIALMRKAGSVVAEMHEVCTRAAKPGATTADLDAAAREVLARRGAQSNFLNYHGFPAVACISPNEVIVHGIPGDRRHRRRRHRVGRLRRHRRGLARRRRDHRSRWVRSTRSPAGCSKRPRPRSTPAIAETTAGNRLGDIGAAVEGVARAGGLRGGPRVRRATGSAPRCTRIPRSPTSGLPAGACACGRAWCWRSSRCSTPGKRPTRLLDDGWTVVTADGSRSAHFEHTVAITENGPEVLTLP